MKRLAIPLAFATLSTAAFAVPTLTVTGKYSVSGGATVLVTPTTTATGFEFDETAFSGDHVVRVAADASIGAVTRFNTEIQGDGYFSGETAIAYSDTITNHSSTALAYTFNFAIAAGSLAFDRELATSVTGQGTRQIQFSLNGNPISEDLISISLNSTSGSCTNETGGGALGTYSTCASPTDEAVYSAAQSFAISLGSLLPGESVALDFSYITRINYEGSSPNNCTTPAPPGMDAISGLCGGANAYIKDPFGQGASGATIGITATPVPGNTVPEPSTLALLACAGASLIHRRRLRRR